MTDVVTEAAPPAKRLAYMIGNPAKKDSRVSFVFNSHWKSYLLHSDQGQRLADLLRADPQDLDAIGELADIQTWIAKQTHGRVTVDDCERLRLDGKPIDYGLTGRITKIIEQGISFSALANFVERASKNPDLSVPEDLYRFMEKGNMPFDPEGYILAFKKVDLEGWSFYKGETGKVQYLPGMTPEMAREDCDPNRQRTCSRGLHACSFDYLDFWYKRQGRVMIVRIDPQHVTAIPMDHNDQKLRCCQMEVVGEISEAEAKEHFSKVVDTRYPVKPVEVVYPAYADSNGGELPGGPETNEDGSRNGWVGNEWLPVTPPDAEDEALELTDVVGEGDPAIRLRLMPVDEDATKDIPPSTPAGWSAKGYSDGEEAGAADRRNDYSYQPDLGIPVGIEDDETARSAYSKGYVEGYDAGFRAEPEPAAEEDEA